MISLDASCQSPQVNRLQFFRLQFQLTINLVAVATAVTGAVVAAESPLTAVQARRRSCCIPQNHELLHSSKQLLACCHPLHASGQKLSGGSEAAAGWNGCRQASREPCV